jgi:ketosteroid isomerase-like protein
LRARIAEYHLATLPGDTRLAMSQENVELVGRTMDAYNARDLSAYLDTLSESVRFQSRFTAMDRVVYRGHDGLRRYFAELDEVWSRYEMRVRRLVAAGHQVAALCHLYAVGRESGLLIEEDSAVVFTLATGRIVRIDAYPTHAEALDAVGLLE